MTQNWKFEWSPLVKKREFNFTTVTKHPLVNVSSNFSPLEFSNKSVNLKNSKSSLLVNSLRALEGSDPLSDVLAESGPLSSNTQSTEDKCQLEDEACDVSSINFSWQDFGKKTLCKFSTRECITVNSGFLEFVGPNLRSISNPNIVHTGGLSMSEVIKSRLNQLEKSGDVHNCASKLSLGNLSQNEYIYCLNDIKESIEQVWNCDQRVKALKIVIQCIKTINLSLPECFYPHKFYLVIECLDSLADLVHQRLNQLSDDKSSNSQFDCEETALNWLHKILFIRDLLPRIYLEAALIFCHRFIQNGTDIRSIISRLIFMCRGLGDPLVASYARMYIMKQASLIGLVLEGDLLNMIMQDFKNSLNWGWAGRSIDVIEPCNEEIQNGKWTAIRILKPPLEYLSRCISQIGSFHNFHSFIQICESMNGIGQYIFVYSAVLFMPPSFIAMHSAAIGQLIDESCHHAEYPDEILLHLGSIVNQITPPQEIKLTVLLIGWKMVMKLEDIYLCLKSCLDWIQYASNNFSSPKVDRLLSDILKKISTMTSIELNSVIASILRIIRVSLSYTKDQLSLLSMASFQGLLSLFQKEVGYMSICSSNFPELSGVCGTIIENYNNDVFSNFDVVQLLLSLFAAMHQGINALTTDDEKRQISHLVSSLISKVSLKEPEAQMQFYTEARAAFSTLDDISEELIIHVLRLQMITGTRKKGLSKTKGFQKACSAFCFITIPSIVSPLARMRLYLHSGVVAMVNQCMGQGDACVKIAIKEVVEVCNSFSNEVLTNANVNNKSLVVRKTHLLLCDEIISAFAVLISNLIALPAPSDAPSPLYLFNGLFNAVKNFKAIDINLYCRVILLLLRGVCIHGGGKLPYSFVDVPGNDILFSGEIVFEEDSQSLCNELMNEALFCLRTSLLEEKNLWLELLHIILIFGYFGSQRMVKLAQFLLDTSATSSGKNYWEGLILKKNKEIKSS